MSELRGEATDPVTLSRWRKCWRRIWKALKAFYAFAGVVRIVGGAVVVVITIVVYIHSKSHSPPATEPPTQKHLTILAVGPAPGSKEFAFWGPITAGIREAESLVWLPAATATKKHVDIVFQNQATQEANSADVAYDICDKKDVLLVMGYVETTVARSALEVYTSPWCNLPVILIATTGTRLTAATGQNPDPRVLRLPPSNYQQAVHLVDALHDTFGTGKCTVSVFLDYDNREYADNLWDMFQISLGAAQSTGYVGCIAPPTPFKITQDNIAELGSRLNNELVKGVDVVILFGMRDKAVPLVRSLRAVHTQRNQPKKAPILILSDGSTTPEFVRDASNVGLCTWGLFPAGESGRLGNPSDLPSYYLYGYDAVVVAKKIVLSGGSPPSRDSVAQELKLLTLRKNEFVAGRAGYYEFWLDGGMRFLFPQEPNRDDPTEGEKTIDQYHLWQVLQKGSLPPAWYHRKGHRGLDTCEDD